MLGNIDEAIEEYEEALKYNPMHERAHVNLENARKARSKEERSNLAAHIAQSL